VKSAAEIAPVQGVVSLPAKLTPRLDNPILTAKEGEQESACVMPAVRSIACLPEAFTCGGSPVQPCL